MAVRHFRWVRMNQGLYVATSPTLKLEVIGASPYPTSKDYYWTVANKKTGAALAEGKAGALDLAIEQAERAGFIEAVKLGTSA